MSSPLPASRRALPLAADRHAQARKDTTARGGTPAEAPLQSALYVGWVRHRRHAPKPHAFRYPLFMMLLDLDELDRVFAKRWCWSTKRRALCEFRRSDFLGDPARPLDEEVRDLVERQTGHRPSGPVRLLTHLRQFGYSFNPVSLYYCYAADGVTLTDVVAEITNTPWKQRHQYVLPVACAQSHGSAWTWSFDKRFHVSPFMAMAHHYRWTVQPPSDALRIHMDVLPPADHGGEKAFDATLVLQRRSITAGNLASTLLRFPLMTLQVIVAIHWQALRLWWRGNPVHDHPHKKAPTP
ncbi:MAG: DUF1365 domain-containing protein [Pseudoxanthomonas sp.]